MKKETKSAIKEYQCSGCMDGPGLTCHKPDEYGGVGCGNHFAGTMISFIGKVFLGMPKGFNRLGFDDKLRPNIYETFESSDWTYDKWNIPTWKYLSPAGHTFVRGHMPRKNQTFVHIFLEDCMDKIDCHEITQEDVDFMD